MEKALVVVGDVHGCLEEFDELVRTLQYNKNTTQLILLGDLMDRGPDPVGCVRRAQEIGAEVIMGNHEEKHLRWRRHEKKQLETGKPNPMRRMSDVDRKSNEALSDKDITWMKSMPLKLALGYNWWAVHAGCEPRYTLDKQNPSQIMRVRYVDERGVGIAINPDKSQPAGTVYWTEQWKGPESLVYGHCVHDLKAHRYDHISDDVTCLGIDTGCCFGGHLTAAIFKSNANRPMRTEPEGYDISYVQVKAKAKYFAGYGDE